MIRFMTASALALGASVTTAAAQTEVHWWHAMGGENGAKLEEIVAGYNASQQDFVVVPTFKGTYPETMTAAIAAFRAGEQPAIVQVFEVGTGTMMAAKGATYPVYQLMADMGEPFDPAAFLPAVLTELMRDIGIPAGIGAVGYDEGDIPDLVDGTMKQQRLLATAPRPVTEDDVADVYRRSIDLW